MYVNNNSLLLLTALTALILSVNIEKCHSISSYPSGTIREENYIRKQQQLLQKQHEQEETGNKKSNKIKKEYSNKEVVFGQDDDDDNSNNNSEELTKLERNQRTDLHNKKYHHEPKLNQKLHAFHKNKLLQELLLNQKENSFNFEYNDMIDKQLLKDSELFEDEMRNKEIGPSLGLNRLFDLDQENMAKLAGQIRPFNEINSNKNKPVNVKENSISENEYNKQIIQDPKEKNPFFDNEDFFKGINLNVNEEGVKAKLSSSAINSPPSMVNKQANPNVAPNIDAKIDQIKKQNDYLFIFVVAGCTLAGVVALVAAGVCWYTVYRSSKAIKDDEFGTKSGSYNPASLSKLSTTSSGDRRLAQSAQMYHYQHQKQQMIAMEKANNDTKPDNSDNSEGETEEGDYTVYECPGLAPTGEMEVKNPLFKEDLSSSTSNIFSSTMPPAYSTLNANKETTEQPQNQLIDIEGNKDSVIIQVTETSSTPAVQDSSNEQVSK